LPLLTTDEQRSWTLYRTGVAEQRLGQFEAADRTFAEVQARYPSSEAASRARDRMGKRAFFVQLATYSKGQLADALVAQLAREGQSPRRVIDAKGHHVVSVGPFGNFDSAKQARQRFAPRFPDALIVP
jgi:cell division protein FtsN